jgi:ubiquinone/menaquinone biosynthesis methyltransferase
MSDAVRSMFDRIAPTYDALNRTLSLGIDRRWRRRAIDALGLGELGGARVIDLCTGTGDLAAEVARRFPEARVTAVDFSAAMLAAGVAAGKLGRGIVAVQADAQRLPFGEGSFDAALCAFGVRNLDDPLAGLREARRVLVPGGRFAVLEFFRPTSRPRRWLHALYNRNVLPAVGGIVSGDRGAYRYLAESMERFLTRAGYEALAREAGFRVVSGEELFPAVASLVVLEVPSC